jgi:tRNA (guanine37-N1)-methyltransferase
MRFDIITIFPGFFSGPLDYGIVRRAREAYLIEAHVHDLRNFTHDRHRTVDDRPFGGGAGMVMKPEPIFEAVESLLGEQNSGGNTSGANAPPGTAIVLLSAAGILFRQEAARRFAKLDRIVLLCGRYEGVDERVAQHLATDEISIGDFVLSGGELPAAMILDAVTRLIRGALGNEDSAVDESFSEIDEGVTSGAKAPLRRDGLLSRLRPRPTKTDSVDGPDLDAHLNLRLDARAANPGILDYPHYTRPQSFRGWDVPEVLVGGNHEEVRRWREKQALEKTRCNRPDLLDGIELARKADG